MMQIVVTSEEIAELQNIISDYNNYYYGKMGKMSTYIHSFQNQDFWH